MCVPFCTGVPAPVREAVVPPLPLPPFVAMPFSMTVATIVAWLLRDTEVVSGISVMTLPVGARRGTLLHEVTMPKKTMALEATTMRARRRCATINDANNSSLMSLRGQETGRGCAGYAMAALLVALAVMAVMMSVAMPVWRHETQRQKEDELIWRGNQYVRAIRLYASKNGGILPPSIDALVSGHFIRKKYKDPITNDEFDYLGAGATTPGLPAGQGQGRGGQPQNAPAGSQPLSGTSSTGMIPGGLSGVRSKSKDESIKVYQGRTHYNEWTFIYVSQQPGGPGRGQPGQIGPNGQPLGPGRGLGPNGQPLGPNGQPIPFPPGRGGPNGPGRGTFPPGFPPNPGRGGRGL